MRKKFQCHALKIEEGGFLAEGYGPNYDKTLSDFSDQGDLIIFKDNSAALIGGLQHRKVLATFSPYMVETYIKTEARRTWA